MEVPQVEWTQENPDLVGVRGTADKQPDPEQTSQSMPTVFGVH